MHCTLFYTGNAQIINGGQSFTVQLDVEFGQFLGVPHLVNCNKIKVFFVVSSKMTIT